MDAEDNKSDDWSSESDGVPKEEEIKETEYGCKHYKRACLKQCPNSIC